MQLAGSFTLFAHAMNRDAGRRGFAPSSWTWNQSKRESENQFQLASIRKLARRDERRVRSRSCLILGGNPVFDAPGGARLRPAARLKVKPSRFTCRLYEDETSELCHWHIPEAHYLESWSDARAYDGTVDHCPTVDRAALRGKERPTKYCSGCRRWPAPERSPYSLVREQFCGEQSAQADDFELFWKNALHELGERMAALAARRVSSPSNRRR